MLLFCCLIKVGVAGFEPATSRLPDENSTTELHPVGPKDFAFGYKKFGAKCPRGLEPPTFGITTRYSTFELRTQSGQQGSNLRHPVSKTGTLPLSYTQIIYSLTRCARSLESAVHSLQSTAFEPLSFRDHSRYARSFRSHGRPARAPLMRVLGPVTGRDVD